MITEATKSMPLYCFEILERKLFKIPHIDCPQDIPSQLSFANIFFGPNFFLVYYLLLGGKEIKLKLKIIVLEGVWGF